LKNSKVYKPKLSFKNKRGEFMYQKRRPNFFEKILLLVGVILIIVGYGLMHNRIVADGVLTWQAIQAVFTWLVLVVLVILLAVNENMKEELKVIAERQLSEIRLLTGSAKTKILGKAKKTKRKK
jgi:hypothetical protein